METEMGWGISAEASWWPPEGNLEWYLSLAMEQYSWKKETVYARLRIGHCGLKATRTRFSTEFDPLCDCGDPETIQHVLLDCLNYSTRREAMRNEFSFQFQIGFPLNLKNMLGGANTGLAMQLVISQSVSRFLCATNLLSRIWGNLDCLPLFLLFCHSWPVDAVLVQLLKYRSPE